MDNDNIAAVFVRIAHLLEIKGEHSFKIIAYERAADSIRNWDAPLSDMEISTMKAIPGVGQAIAEKIQELNTSGHLQFLQKLEAEIPPALLDWLTLPGVGPKTTALIWRSLGITTLPELYQAAKDGKLHTLSGIGQKLESNILQALQQQAID